MQDCANYIHVRRMTVIRCPSSPLGNCDLKRYKPVGSMTPTIRTIQITSPVTHVEITLPRTAVHSSPCMLFPIAQSQVRKLQMSRMKVSQSSDVAGRLGRIVMGDSHDTRTNRSTLLEGFDATPLLTMNENGISSMSYLATQLENHIHIKLARGKQ
ncbi:hypothetical protein EJ05DRAFT_143467 [Pseudovirgaria hyperparasitica]|uniref:Uncharacterized protein n=1 Tax=Pseudovirgaria hyperparasitica TaxID=470096 RepID=A0A6A6VVA6_9PEZI|nr:uncharacterized protein EJ05DRAFT_143467 [Pseudovirgaria hyperparasitica]KAF2754502.1 hypothetical protein EJ05DRAFT_143467 [Pseudovirgaria hyperparasitica]